MTKEDLYCLYEEQEKIGAELNRLSLLCTSRMTQKEKFMHELSLERIKIEYNWVREKYNGAREKYLRIMRWYEK